MPAHPAFLAFQGVLLPLLVPGLLPLPLLVPQSTAVFTEAGAWWPQGPWVPLVVELLCDARHGTLAAPSCLHGLAPLGRWGLHHLVPNDTEGVACKGAGEGALHRLALIQPCVLSRQLADQEPLLEDGDAVVLPNLEQMQEAGGSELQLGAGAAAQPKCLQGFYEAELGRGWGCCGQRTEACTASLPQLQRGPGTFPAPTQGTGQETWALSPDPDSLALSHLLPLYLFQHCCPAVLHEPPRGRLRRVGRALQERGVVLHPEHQLFLGCREPCARGEQRRGHRVGGALPGLGPATARPSS